MVTTTRVRFEPPRHPNLPARCRVCKVFYTAGDGYVDLDHQRAHTCKPCADRILIASLREQPTHAAA